ncbi:MAG TPA: O-antigen ligase family protein [Pyrinomonadaceae bacterium]
MQKKHPFTDYEAVKPSTRRTRAAGGEEAGDLWTVSDNSGEARRSSVENPGSVERLERVATLENNDEQARTPHGEAAPHSEEARPAGANASPFTLKRGHLFSYLGLFLFTVVLYFRPYELHPSLAGLTSLAYWLALATLAVFLPTQLALEGNLTTRPREVNLVLLLCVAALLSIPFAIDPGEAWGTFNYIFIKAVIMFIVIVNVVRTPLRLKGMIFLGLAIGCVLSVGAINDYRLGRFVVGDERVAGVVGGMFGNPNDLALHLVTMIPLAVGLLLSTRNLLAKPFYALCALLMVGGVIASFSRGAFIGLLGASMVLAWKLGRRNRFLMIILIGVFLVALLALAPGEYTERISSIGSVSRDASSSSRRDLLVRSIIVAIANPVFGVGMGNFHIVSIRELVSHNAYTQVAAEMGLAAMCIYIMMLVVPLKRLRLIEHATYETRRGSRIYYLSVALQASLVAYMMSSFFGSVAYQFYVYYLIGYAVALRRIYEAQTGMEVVPLSKKEKRAARAAAAVSPQNSDTDFPEPESPHSLALRTGM